MIGLTLVGCATRRGAGSVTEAPPGAGDPAEIAHRCEEFARRFGYAEKTVGGRVALSAFLTPLMIGVGLAGTMTGNLGGLALAIEGPIEMGRWTAKASKENQDQRNGLRHACEEGGGPDTVVAARAVRDLAQARERERSTGDATRLYRDTLEILDRADAGESEDAALAALLLASLVEKKAPADPEIGSLYERAVRIRESERETHPRELATLHTQYARWLRSAGRTVDAEAMEARADALTREAQVAEERARAASFAEGRASSTDIVVGESCAPASVHGLDQLNQDTAAQGGAGRVLAVDCDAAGQISAVRLTTPKGVSDALTFSDPDTNPVERIRAALLTPEP
jgi:hypothetical protein